MAKDAADRYRRLAGTMTDRIAAVPAGAWSQRTPCEEWTVQQLVEHLVEVHGIFQGLVGRSLVDHPPVGDDPLGAWTAARDQTQADLDDPERADEEYDGMLGRSTFAASVDGFVCFDLVLHGWDLARATGQDESIDPAEVVRIQAMVDKMGSMMIENGVIREQLEAPPEASAQDRLLASVGRRA